MPSIDYAQRAVTYWAKSELAYADGDPHLGDDLSEAAAQCEDWAREDRTGVYSDVA